MRNSQFEKCIIKVKYNYRVHGLPMQSATSKKSSVKNILKYMFGGLSLLYIGILFFMVVHDTMTGQSSLTAEYCKKYGFLASPECW